MRIIDPLGGAYALEALTDESGSEGRGYIDRIDEMGGMVSAIAQGYPQREIEDAAYRVQKEIEDKSRVIVGVNEFAAKDDLPFEVMKVDPALEAEQVQRLQVFRAARDSGAATRALDALRRSARSSENLLPVIVAAVKARCTLGEIANALRDVFGEHGR